jgi:hypothetical protein
VIVTDIDYVAGPILRRWTAEDAEPRWIAGPVLERWTGG